MVTEWIKEHWCKWGKTGFELEKIPKEWKIVGKWHDGKKVNKKLERREEKMYKRWVKNNYEVGYRVGGVIE